MIQFRYRVFFSFIVSNRLLRDEIVCLFYYYFQNEIKTSFFMYIVAIKQRIYFNV